jgi:hypothetical protein
VLHGVEGILIQFRADILTQMDFFSVFVCVCSPVPTVRYTKMHLRSITCSHFEKLLTQRRVQDTLVS